MKILVANLGSTSLKYRLFDFSDGGERMLIRGGFERVTDYPAAIESCLSELRQGGHIADARDLAAVGFKAIMARGINGCVRLDAQTIKAMEVCNAIAPAHNPAYGEGIKIFSQKMPDTPLVALFETAFYQWAPEAAMRYAVPESWLEKGVRRWGFHGASHKFIAERSAELLGREDVAERARNLYVTSGKTRIRNPDLRVISCHLGGSSSITGILNGVAIGNSMGMSPQSGLPHNNRVGDLDSFALPYLMRSHGLTLDEAERQMNKESGLKGLSGKSNDIRDVVDAATKGDTRSQMALDVLAHHVRHWIGSYFLQLNGADAIVFTAGIGENQVSMRTAICQNLDRLGIQLDTKANDTLKGAEGMISAPDSRVKIFVIPTNEELVVARETRRLLLN